MPWAVLLLAAAFNSVTALLVPNGPLTNRTECGGTNGPVWADMFCAFAGVAIQYGDVAQYTLQLPSEAVFESKQFDITIQLRPDDNSNVDL